MHFLPSFSLYTISLAWVFPQLECGLIGLKFNACLHVKLYSAFAILSWHLIYIYIFFEFILQFTDMGPKVEVLSLERKLQYINHPGRFDCFLYIFFFGGGGICIFSSRSFLISVFIRTAMDMV